MQDNLLAFVGHLLNPQVCGQPFSEVAKMSMQEGQAVLNAINKSNEKIAKENKKSKK